MKASISLVVFAIATLGMGSVIENRQNSWGPYTCPTKAQCEASCEAAGLVYAANDCNNAWVNCACDYS
ncbi:uncharacterized protein EAE97_011016 [Botrytis byssoidea]|uniref:Invertebrate defensins family profile domain-containing protein n=1 Tax=Botrytis byssoidea TaxID=139641 RepID=A0A9P5HWZ1_9HELO|nr:uncharacterized protein EAE97_011016 [Botrytis byssoidea]KAF7922852.1 hypothetical protein EAE97_011016 [Botrytis byssoidea]